MVTFPFADAVSNPLEAGIFVGESDTLTVSNLTNHLGGNDGLNNIHVITHLTEAFHVVDDVIVVHHVGLVTIDDNPFALIVTANNGDTIGIGVGGDHEVCTEFGTQVHAHGHGFGVLGVRTNHGWEIAIDHHLFGYDMDVLEAPRAEAHGDNLTSCTMHG